MKMTEMEFKDMIEKEVTMYGLPYEVKFCKKCVISNQRPSSRAEYLHTPESKVKSIHFDEEGVCDACNYQFKKSENIDWGKREKELINLCDRYRSRDGYYDCIVPGSGGKDSIKAAWLLKYKYDMNPLTVTWAPHMYTDVGRKNHERWIDAGFDNVLFSPNGKTHRLLTKLAFENLLHPFQPFILGQKNIGAKFASLYNISLVFYGESEAEYGNPIASTEIALREAKYHAGTNYQDMYLGGVSFFDLINKYKLKINDLLPYLPMDPEEFKEKQIQVHYTGYYIKWDPQEAYYLAVEKTGFEANDERTEGTYSKYNSIDDKSDPFHYFTTLIKFGIGRATYDASQEIRNGKIEREEGVALVKKFDHEFPKRYFPEMLEYMGLTEYVFWDIINQHRSPHLWKLENKEWKLKHTVY